MHTVRSLLYSVVLRYQQILPLSIRITLLCSSEAILKTMGEWILWQPPNDYLSIADCTVQQDRVYISSYTVHVVFLHCEYTNIRNRSLGLENTYYILRPGQDGLQFRSWYLKTPFLNEIYCIFIQLSLEYIPKYPIINKSVLAQVMAWCWTSEKSIPEPMFAQFTDV